MAGRFITNNTKGVLTQSVMSDSIVSAVKTILHNPYYLLSDKRASKCTYYNLNTTMTTLDESTRGNYGEISPESPLRYNKVLDFFIYGVSKIEPGLEIAEYGLEASDISGEAIVLPYTVVPYPGDFFILTQLDRPLLFKVIGVDINTLDTGAIMYKIQYTLSSSDGREYKEIESQVVKTLKFLIQNLGTNFGTLIEEVTYDEASELEELSTKLKDYYISLFYDDKIQSFSYNYSNNGTIGGSLTNAYGYYEFMGFKVYDSYLIEFLIRNLVLKGSTQYIYIDHQITLPQTFAVDYDRTFFATLETKDMNHHIGTYVGNLLKCDQRLSLLYAYPWDYYIMEYNNLLPGLFLINIFDSEDFNKRMKDNEKFANYKLQNIIIGYMNNEDLTDNDIETIKHLDYYPTKDLFYLLPMIIFIIDKNIIKMLS